MSRDIIIVDGTSITQEGWKGSVKLRDILWQAAPAVLQDGGVRREIASRISRIVQVQPMTEADFYEILNIRSMSPIADLEHKFGVVIDVDDSVKRQVAKEAAESGLGVRCIESKILAMLEDEVFVAPDMCICQVKNITIKIQKGTLFSFAVVR